MSPGEQIRIALVSYLLGRGDKIASDQGPITFRAVGGELVAEVGGASYVLEIAARRA